MEQQHSDQQNTVSRRLVNLFLGLGFVGTMGGFMGTALAYLLPLRGAFGAAGFISGRQGPLIADEIGEDQGVVGRSHLGKILIIRKNDRLIGLQATCTHLGCTVAWNGATQQIECPCHGARYTIHGQVLRGPARDPLEQIELVASDQGIRLAPLKT